MASTSHYNVLDGEEIETKANQLVDLFFIFSSQRKLLKRSDIVKNVIKENIGQYEEIFRLTQKVLLETFGFRLKKVKDGYILFNNLSKEEQRLLDINQVEKSLLSIILVLIYMLNGEVDQELLFRQLSIFGVVVNQPHPLFKNVKKLLLSFQHEQYLIKITEDSTDPDEAARISYKFGPRAFLEFNKIEALKLVSKIMGYKDETVWSTLYNTALEEQQPVLE